MNTRPGVGAFTSALSPPQIEALVRLEALAEAKDDVATTCACIQELGWLFTSAEYKANVNNAFKDPLVQFLVGASMRQDGVMKACRDITSLVAALQYTIRLLFFKKCLAESVSTGEPLLE